MQRTSTGPRRRPGPIGFDHSADARPLRRSLVPRSTSPIVKPDLALLVDGDQLPPGGLAQLVERLETDWTVSQRTVIRNWRSTRDQQEWRAFGDEHGFRCLQRDPVAVGKNASDIELAVEAMDLLHGLHYRAFCIVSGDTDFTPLVHRLKRSGSHVEWVGPADVAKLARSPTSKSTPSTRPARAAETKQAPQATKATPRRRATPAKTARPTPAKKPSEPTDKQRAFARHVRRAITELRERDEHERGWVSVNRVGTLLGEKKVRREDHGFAKSRQLRAVLDELGFKLEQVETGSYRVTMD